MPGRMLQSCMLKPVDGRATRCIVSRTHAMPAYAPFVAGAIDGRTIGVTVLNGSIQMSTQIFMCAARGFSSKLA